jgi:dihydroorotase
MIRIPGFTDVHVHLRVPGGEHKEDFVSGSQAALAGGITRILAMPNTHPPITSVARLKKVIATASEKALCDVRFYAGVSTESIHQLPEISDQAVGLKLYMNAAYGPLGITDLRTLNQIFRIWPKNKPIAVHAEGAMMATAIGLAASFTQSLHICHVSLREEIELIADAKSRHLPITCEVTPHHLFLTGKDATQLGALGEMRPPLATSVDVKALWEHINSTIDCIASDHAPHTLSEKNSDNPPSGVPGLETTIPLLLDAVLTGKLSLERLIELMDTNPRKIYHLPIQSDTWVEVDPDAHIKVDNTMLYTKCGWSPFQGREVQGKIKRVILRGRLAFEDGKIVHE